MIEVNHNSMVCPHFTQDGMEFEKTVVIGPIRIFEEYREEGQKVYDLVIGCNYFRNCQNMDCGYSWVSRQERKKSVSQVPS